MRSAQPSEPNSRSMKMQDMPVLQSLLPSPKRLETRASLPRFHVISPPQWCRSCPIQPPPSALAATRLPLSLQTQTILTRSSISQTRMRTCFNIVTSRQGTIGSSTPLATIIIFYGRNGGQPYSSRDHRHRGQGDLSARNIAALADVWPGFTAVQKPSPLASQALGSGQPDQPLCQ